MAVGRAAETEQHLELDGRQSELSDLAREFCREAKIGLGEQTDRGDAGVVDRLERDSLVKRTACPSDRRSLYTVITQSGQQKLNAALPEHLRLIEKWFTGLLTPEALDGLLSGLRTVRDAVRPGAEAGAKSAVQIH